MKQGQNMSQKTTMIQTPSDIELLEEYDVPKNRVAAIPYSPELERACRDQTVDDLIPREIGRRKHTEYFNRIKNITKQVLIEGEKLVFEKMMGTEGLTGC